MFEILVLIAGLLSNSIVSTSLTAMWYVPRLVSMYAQFLSHPVLKAKPNALITCAPGSSYTHA
jgi:antibiotic biosynthesis monooxygenase (ABM) superfamily enzyme